MRRFSGKVGMVLDPEVDATYPRRWIGLAGIEPADGGRFISRVEVPKGDPGNTPSREEPVDKTRGLAAFADGASGEELDRIVARIRGLEKETNVRDLLPEGSA